ncbi:tyrosine protein phosphatase 1 [Tilletia horrida]|nr:tyrosine protein phosphatase 1 [Tilletia horrida]
MTLELELDLLMSELELDADHHQHHCLVPSGKTGTTRLIASLSSRAPLRPLPLRPYLPAQASASRAAMSRAAALDVQLELAMARLNALDDQRLRTWVEYVRQHVQQYEDQDEDEDEDGPHASGSSSTAFSWSRARLNKRNVDFNRYNNIASWDHALLPGPYLNASYIPALPLKGSRADAQAYVATQAPLPATFPTFFAHLAAQRVRVLVMLTPLRERGMPKAHQYWPSSSSSSSSASPASSSSAASQNQSASSSLSARLHQLYSGHHHHQEGTNGTAAGAAASQTLVLDDSGWAVELIEEQELHAAPLPSSAQDPARRLPPNAALHLRRLRIHIGTNPSPADCRRDPTAQQTNSGTHELVQLHLSSWADHGADSLETLDVLLDWIDHFQYSDRRSDAQPAIAQPPIWAHCSAGVGRSGTVIAAHMLRHIASLSFTTLPLAQIPSTTIPDPAERAFLLSSTDDDENDDHEGEREGQEEEAMMHTAIGLVAYLRRFRPSMVQTVKQLDMVYEAALAAQRRSRLASESGSA